MAAVLDIQLDRLRPRLAHRDLTLEVTAAARSRLAERGYDPELGARPLRRLVQQAIIDPLSKAILAGGVRPGQTIVVDVDAADGGDQDDGVGLRVFPR
jgi:ATP-dependent Clp protease ATP-binding subunit ClpB